MDDLVRTNICNFRHGTTDLDKWLHHSGGALWPPSQLAGGFDIFRTNFRGLDSYCKLGRFQDQKEKR